MSSTIYLIGGPADLTKTVIPNETPPPRWHVAVVYQRIRPWGQTVPAVALPKDFGGWRVLISLLQRGIPPTHEDIGRRHLRSHEDVGDMSAPDEFHGMIYLFNADKCQYSTYPTAAWPQKTMREVWVSTESRADYLKRRLDEVFPW